LREASDEAEELQEAGGGRRGNRCAQPGQLRVGKGDQIGPVFDNFLLWAATIESAKIWATFSALEVDV
jgi:hypothetical protein